MPINFTVNYDQLTNEDDSANSWEDNEATPLIGPVVFTPQFRDERPLLAPNASPRPAGFIVREFTGYIDTDGRLKNKRGGSIGTRLWARDPDFRIDHLWYKVEFSLATPIGKVVTVTGGYFEAPTTDTPVNLVSVLQQTGSPGIGITQGLGGDPVDDVALDGDGNVVFYVQGSPIGDPLHLDVIDLSSVDGGTPSDPGDDILDGGTP